PATNLLRRSTESGVAYRLGSDSDQSHWLALASSRGIALLGIGRPRGTLAAAPKGYGPRSGPAPRAASPPHLLISPAGSLGLRRRMRGLASLHPGRRAAS